jgi:hypothetical protein
MRFVLAADNADAQRLLFLGASHLGGDRYADPDGNEFCLMTRAAGASPGTTSR